MDVFEYQLRDKYFIYVGYYYFFFYCICSYLIFEYYQWNILMFKVNSLNSSFPIILTNTVLQCYCRNE